MRLQFFFSSRRRHTRLVSDWSSDVCSSDLLRHALEISGPDLVLTLDPALQGLPETAHGGPVLAVFDTLSGTTAPREVSGIYRRRVPLGLPLTLVRALEDSADTFVLSDQAGSVLVDRRVSPLPPATDNGTLGSAAGNGVGHPLPT